jgi:hypothetical protein
VHFWSHQSSEVQIIDHSLGSTRHPPRLSVVSAFAG